MVERGTLSEAEIKKGQRVDPLKFGDLLFRNVINNPLHTDSGLIYARSEDGSLVYTEVNPMFLSRLK